MANLVLIRSLCEEKKITLRELSRRINRKESTMQSMIRNGSTTTGTLEAISDVLGVSPGVFFEETTPKGDLQIELEYLRKLIKEKDQVIAEKERMIELLMEKKQ